MELNAEQVKKWLEICAQDTPYPDQSQALIDALSLITLQEHRIKELTNRNEILEAKNRVNDRVGEDYIKVCEENEKLTEENERLRANNLTLAHELERVMVYHYKIHNKKLEDALESLKGVKSWAERDENK